MDSSDLEKLNVVKSKLQLTDSSNAKALGNNGGLLSQLSTNPFFTAVSLAFSPPSASTDSYGRASG